MTRTLRGADRERVDRALALRDVAPAPRRTVRPALLGRPESSARSRGCCGKRRPLLAESAADVVLDELVDDVGGLGPLEPLLGDASITEIMVNGADRVFVERGPDRACRV